MKTAALTLALWTAATAAAQPPAPAPEVVPMEHNGQPGAWIPEDDVRDYLRLLRLEPLYQSQIRVARELADTYRAEADDLAEALTLAEEELDAQPSPWLAGVIGGIGALIVGVFVLVVISVR